MNFRLHRLGGQLLRANERNEKLIEGLLVLVDLDRVRCAPQPLATAGIGDMVANLSAVQNPRRCQKSASRFCPVKTASNRSRATTCW